MKIKNCILFACAMTIGIFVQGQNTSNSTTMNVDEMVNAYLETIGGVNKWKNVTSMRIVGSMSYSGMEFPISVIQAPPNLIRKDYTAQSVQITEAYDGTNAWTMNTLDGTYEPQLLSADEAQSYSNDMFENEFINYKQKGHRVKYTGDKEINGSMCHELKMTKRNGTLKIYYFDKEFMLPVMIKEFITTGPQNGQTIETYFGDYQEVDGLFMPFNQESKINGQVMSLIIFNRVEINVPINYSDFAFPGY